MILNLILIGFLVAIAAPYIHKVTNKFAGVVLALFPVAVFVYFLNLLSVFNSSGPLKFQTDWFSQLGINFNFVVDGLSLTFALIISGIGAIIVFYASGYLKGNPKIKRFYGYLMFFMTSMLGVVLSDNIISLFIFWELTSISSYLLIGFNHETERSRYASLQALLVTAGGGLLLMAGLIIMGSIAGTYSITEMINQPEIFNQHQMYIPLVVLVLIGAFTKSAQFPFHFWLPNAMEAPTPVSAYLHSATMVKAGVFLIARLSPALGGTQFWHTTLIVFGGITMLMGAFMAIGKNDLKKILAYTTISALGVMVFLLGVGGDYGYTAAISFLVAHALYKGTLFLVAGAIDHETGTRDIRLLGGLGKFIPLIALGAVFAAFSFSGIPPFFGFIAKELVYESTLHSLISPQILTILAIVTNMLLVAAAIMVGIAPFFGKHKETPKHPHHAPITLWLGPVLLGSLGLVLGVFPNLISDSLISSSVFSMAKIEAVHLHLWHGFNSVLLLSAITLVGGVAVFFVSFFLRKNTESIEKIEKFGPETLYNILLNGLIKYSKTITSFFQDGYLRHYFYWILLTFMFFITLIFVNYDLISLIKFDFSDLYFYEVIIVLIMIFAAVKAINSKSVLASVAALGIVGFGVALLFAFLSAPDLALTQFSIETLTVILLVLVVWKVPRFSKISSKGERKTDAIFAITSGAIVTILVILVINSPSNSTISQFFLENSLIKAHGRNVVNVILVDFRGFDTMGEITVLSIAALGVYTLLKFSNRKRKNSITKHFDTEI